MSPYQRGDYLTEIAVAEALVKQAEAFGPDDDQLLFALKALADLNREHRRYAVAEPLYQRLLAIVEKMLGPDHCGPQ